MARSALRVTNGNCPIWKWDVYDDWERPIEDDGYLADRVQFDDDWVECSEHPWDCVGYDNGWFDQSDGYIPEITVDKYVEMTDGTVVFYWLNFTVRVETKGEVVSFFPFNFKIKVCGDENLSRTPKPFFD